MKKPSSLGESLGLQAVDGSPSRKPAHSVSLGLLAAHLVSVILAISTFSPVGSLSSNGLRMRACVYLCVALV